MEIKITDFATREELEIKVKGGDITAITGTSEELKRLNLSNTTSIHGVPCKASDSVKTEKTEKPNRGEVFESNLDGAPLKKSKKTK